MAEAGAHNRIGRGLFSRVGGEALRELSVSGRAVGAIMLHEIIPDDNLDTRIGHMVLPVITETDGKLLVPTWRVAVELSKNGKIAKDRTLQWEAMRLGANPDAALVVPRERVRIFEPL